MDENQLESCLATAYNFLLSEAKAHRIFEKLIAAIEQNWDGVCEEADLNKADKNRYGDGSFESVLNRLG